MKTYRKQTIIQSWWQNTIILYNIVSYSKFIMTVLYNIQEGRSFSLSWHDIADPSSWEIASASKKEWEWENGHLQLTANQICELSCMVMINKNPTTKRSSQLLNYFACLGPHKFYFMLHATLKSWERALEEATSCSVNLYTSSLVYCFVVLVIKLIIVNVLSFS